MPQLDVATYLSQFFWVAIIFLFFYLIWLRFLIPILNAILYVRDKYILDFKKLSVGTTYNNFWNLFLTKSISHAENILNSKDLKQNENVYKNTFNIYINNLSESASRFYLIKNIFSTIKMKDKYYFIRKVIK